MGKLTTHHINSPTTVGVEIETVVFKFTVVAVGVGSSVEMPAPVTVILHPRFKCVAH